MEITNQDSVIDSRDVIARIDELEDTYDDLNQFEMAELVALKGLADDATCDAWGYGKVLVNKNYFTEYCKELCEDIGDVPGELPWYIESNIDWDGVADAIEMDYTKVDFDGEIYLIRAG